VPASTTATGHDGMKLYAGTTEQFRADAQIHRIAEKLHAE
jgi:hypothetical protein